MFESTGLLLKKFEILSKNVFYYYIGLAINIVFPYLIIVMLFPYYVVVIYSL
jgi:hypothetical protein